MAGPKNPGRSIPRERIYEIWSNVQVIRRGTTAIPRNTVITDYGNALTTQSRALNTVVERLRADFRGQLKANAPTLALSIPRGVTGVAFDGKLWVWWDTLEYQTSRLNAHQMVALDASSLEASYDAVRLTNGIPTGNPDEFAFDVLPGSTEAKFDDDEGYLVLGSDHHPGLPLEWPRSVLSPQAPQFQGDPSVLTRPFWSVLGAKFVSFDRTLRTAVVRFSCWKDQTFVNYVIQHSQTSLLNDVFLTKGISTFKWYNTSKDILQAIGNPSIATPDINAARAMGMAPAPAGTAPVTPAARVLWDAGHLHASSVFPTTRANALTAYVSGRHGLNPSQQFAVAHAAEKGLTVIWGPPGTGKTKTLAAYIHGLVNDAVANGMALNILVTGPTYKAVEELTARVIGSLDNDRSSPAEMYIVYSRTRTPAQFVAANPHLTVRPFSLDAGSPDLGACLASLANPATVTIVSTGAMQAHKFAQWVGGATVASVFDVVIIDESSQVQVTHALAPLATLADGGRLVVAGDHLQMPPILALEPPKNAEYLVGSIQTYLLTRPFGSPVHVCPLEENYRSAEDIVAYARTIGYRPTLRSVYPHTSLHLMQPLPPAAAFPATLPWSPVWHDIADPSKVAMALLHEDDLSSQGNLFEAQIVAAIVWSIRQTTSADLDGRIPPNHRVPTPSEFWRTCVGVVTPHRAQRALVTRELKVLFPTDPANLIEDAVDTVEKFQGGERHTVVVTFGVADADVIAGEEAFLMQLERTNVAISRAMAKCIVIMPISLAGHVPQEKKALETAHAIKNYVDEFCNTEVVTTIGVGPAQRLAKLRYRQ